MAPIPLRDAGYKRRALALRGEMQVKFGSLPVDPVYADDVFLSLMVVRGFRWNKV